MHNPNPIRNQNSEILAQHWQGFLGWGVALLLLGICAVCAAVATTIISVVILGAILIISGIALILHTFQQANRYGSAFFLPLGMGIFYLLVGLLLVAGPVPAAISLTLLIAIFFIMIGSARLLYAFTWRSGHWQWRAMSGLLALILGILILAEWPNSSLVIIGLFVGIDLMLLGWSYIMMGLFAKNLNKRV